MKSLTYIAAALLPVINSAYAGNGFAGDGETVIVKATRTVYWCPVADWMTCDLNSYGPTSARTGGPSTWIRPTSTSTSTLTIATTVTTNNGPIDPDNTSTTTSHSSDPSVSTIISTGTPSVITTTNSGSIVISTHNGSVIVTTQSGSVITSVSGTSTIVTTESGSIVTSTSSGSIITSTVSGSVVTTTSVPTSISVSTIDPDSRTGPSTTGHNNGTTSVSSDPDVTTTGATTTGVTTTGHSNGTATITSDPGLTTTTGFSNGTTTTGFSNGTSTISTSSGFQNSTSTSLCFNSTRTAAPNTPFDQGFNGNCNRPGARDQWCDGMSVQTDTDPVYRTGRTRTYTLEIALGSINADASFAVEMFTINGKTPGDPIIANWGDDVEVTVINSLDPNTGNATTIHWHGILQAGTNDQDGVPGVTECGIAPGTSRTYKWHASTYGTTWYHSHLLSQFGGGIRGPIIIHGPASSDYDLDMGTIMMEEKFPSSIFETGKYYATARGTIVASNYLLNGKNLNRDNPNLGEAARWIVKPGKKHLFRLINASTQTGFVFHIDNHKMTVISADMTPIVPYVTDNVFIHSGQRYNVIVKADQPIAAYDVRAIAQQGCGASIANSGLGQSNGVMEYEGSCYTVPATSNFTISTATTCLDEPLASLVPVVTKTAGPSGDFLNKMKNLAGGTFGTGIFGGVGINRWQFGPPTDFTGTANGTATKLINVTYDQPTLQLLPTVGNYGDAIYGNSVFYNSTNQWVYWVIQNAFLTSHPMHLHGHDFSVLGQAYNTIFDSSMTGSLNFDNPIRRDTVLLFGKGGTPPDPPRQPGYTVIGFQTNNPGAWLMHCHIIWHADLGMGMQIVERPDDMPNYQSKPEFQSECSNMKSYEAGGPGRYKAEYESGLKKREEHVDVQAIHRRHLEEHKFNGYSHGHAVRHA